MATITDSDAGGMRNITISAEDLQLSFLPEVGGRLISVRFRGREVLWRNPAYLDEDLCLVKPRDEWPVPGETMGTWANVGGSKTWPAPQGWSGPGEWPGPPDPVLDAGPYEPLLTTADGAATLTLTSAHDARSGLTVSRTFVVGSTGGGFVQAVTFTNTGDEPVVWSVWEVAQVVSVPGAKVVVPQRRGSEPVVMIDAVGARSLSVADDAVATVNVTDWVGKIGFPGATGTISYEGPETSVTLVAGVVDGASYPDGGCPVEVWMQYPVGAPIASLGDLEPDAYLVELEVLGPLTRLEPGQRTTRAITWMLG